MQNTTALYDSIFLNPKHYTEARLDINEVSYYKDTLKGITTFQSVFSGNGPVIGSCVSSEIDVQMLIPDVDIPRMAELRPYVRITDGTRYSEWVQKGEYFIDTRDTSDADVLTIHGFDAMLKAERDYPDDSASYPRAASSVVATIAQAMGVSVDSRNAQYLAGITVPTLPIGYSCREVLSNIAVLACGNWVMSDIGELRFLPLNDLPEETNLLVTEHGDVITFGGVGIIVG